MQLTKLIPAALLLTATCYDAAVGQTAYEPAGVGPIAQSTGFQQYGTEYHVGVPDSAIVAPPAGYPVEYSATVQTCPPGKVGVSDRVWEYLSYKADCIGLWLKLKDRKVKRQTFYPRLAPECHPSYGYYPTRWRRGFRTDYVVEGGALPPGALHSPYGGALPAVPGPAPMPMSEPLPPAGAEPQPAQPQPTENNQAHRAMQPREPRYLQPVRLQQIETETLAPATGPIPSMPPAPPASEASAAQPQVPRTAPHLPVEFRIVGETAAETSQGTRVPRADERAARPKTIEIEARVVATGWRPTDPKRVEAFATGKK